MLFIENGRIPTPLSSVIRGSGCAVFIGSGLSVGYPSWPDLVNALCLACRVDVEVARHSPVDDFLEAAESAKVNDEAAYYRCLGEHFGRAVESIPTIYQVLLSLPFASYLTINFDRLLATEARKAGDDGGLSLYAYPSLDRKNVGGRSIHHLHGFIEQGGTPVDGQIVLAKSEFDEAYRATSNLMNFLVPTLENDPIVFVGCRLQEPGMETVFEICKEHQLTRKQLVAASGASPSEPPPRFILLRQPTVMNGNGEHDATRSEEERRKLQGFYENRDIQPVWYDGRGDDHHALLRAFEQLAGLTNLTPDHGWQVSAHDG